MRALVVTESVNTSRLRRNIIVAEILATWRELVVLKVGQNLLQLEEKALTGLVAIGVHVETS